MAKGYPVFPLQGDGRQLAALALMIGVIWYLVLGTGIFSDDFDLIIATSGRSLEEMLRPVAGAVATPLTHVTHMWPYYLIQFHEVALYDCLKAVYVTLAFFMLRSFFSLWFGTGKSIIVAGLFVFYPIHDAVTYWFIGQYLLLSFALYAFAFFLLERGRPRASFVFALLGSFISYGSTAVACGLALIFVKRRDFRRAALLLAPNLIYVAYYLAIALWFGKGPARIPSQLDVLGLAKQYLLQIGTFLDASIGPSFWLKMFFALGELTVVSAVVAGLVFFALTRLQNKNTADTARAGSADLVWGALGTTLAAFVLFSITGFYPQLAFNLGDRVTIFGNFLIVALLATLPLKRGPWLAVVGLYVAVIFGISDHWKAWNLHQKEVMANIAANPALRQAPPGGTLYVTGNQYSKLGAMSHIEFLSEVSVIQSVFTYALGARPAYQTIPLNARIHYEMGLLIDRKYTNQFPIGESIRVYDSARDSLIDIPAGEINAYIAQRPKDYRNWVQFLGDGPIRRGILFLMPRLEYAL